MDQKEQDELINRYLEGKTTPHENLIVEDLYNRLISEQPDFQYTNDLVSVRDKIYEKLPLPENKSLVRKIWPRVAAAVAVIAFGVWFYASRHPEGSEATWDLYANNIKPGSNKATLTLANGKVINLSAVKSGVVVGEELRYNDNSAVISSTVRDLATLRFVEMTISTPRGGTYQITLSDGTKVWLNAASSLTYTNGLGKDGMRRVKLKGEGYFEVAKDKQHPFIVESRGQEVKVLGTHFNINGYSDEGSVKTTLLEGSVRVANLSPSGRDVGTTERVLKPNQQAILTANRAIQVKDVDVNEAVAWKNGKFVFEYDSIASVMRKLARWYDVEIIYQGDFSGKTFSGSISRRDNISKILEKMTYTQNVQFKIEGRRVTVMP